MSSGKGSKILRKKMKEILLWDFNNSKWELVEFSGWRGANSMGAI